MTANGVDERERSGSVPEFLVIYRYLLSKNLATRSEQQRTRTRKNNDFKTMSERTSAYTSECQISRTLGHFVIAITNKKSNVNLCSLS